MALNGSLDTTSYALTDGTLYLTFSWERTSYSSSDKTSTISWTLKGAGTSTQWANTRNIKVNINGESVYSTSSDPIRVQSGKNVTTGTKIISHDSNGSCTLSVSVSAGIFIAATNVSGSKSFTLDPPYTLTVNYHSNYATESSAQAVNSVSGNTNVLVYTQTFAYSTNYTDGLLNYSASDNFLYLGRTGYKPTGYWGTSTNNSNLVHEDASHTGQSLATALGVDLNTGDKTVNIYPQWTANKYTISYDANGGDGVMSTSTATYGQDFLTNPNTFMRTGYTFNGWNESPDGTGTAWGLASPGVYEYGTPWKWDYTNDITLYAQWKPAIYTNRVQHWRYVGTGGNNGDGTMYRDANEDIVFTAKYGDETPIYEGFANTYTGYYLRPIANSNWGTDTWSGKAIGSTFIQPATDVTIEYAYYYNTYTVTYNANGGYGEMADSTATYNTDFLTNPNTFTKTGYTFAGWNESPDGTGTAWGLTSMGVYEYGTPWKWDYTNDITLYAQWTVNTYKLTINPNGGTYNGVSSNTVLSENYGTVVNIDTPTREGYAFVGWDRSGIGDSTGITNAPSEVNVTNDYKPFSLYNNAENGNVIITIIEDSTSPTGTGYSAQIQVSGLATPDFGGFYDITDAIADQTLVHKFVAKIPKGYELAYGTNAIGNGFSDRWLTSNIGTGDWATYIYQINCGSSGTFQDMGYVYIKNTGQSTPFTWYVASSQVYRLRYVTFEFGDGDGELTANWIPTNVYLKKTDGEWKQYNTYYKKDGEWIPYIVYKKDTDGIWKQGTI